MKLNAKSEILNEKNDGNFDLLDDQNSTRFWNYQYKNLVLIYNNISKNNIFQDDIKYLEKNFISNINESICLFAVQRQ